MAVTSFVVVPADKLHKVIVKSNTSLDVNNAGVGVADEIGGDSLVLGPAQNSLELTGGSLLEGLDDFVVSSGLLDSGGKINNGDVEGGDTEGHTSQLSIELGQYLADGLGGTSAGRDNVGGGSAAGSPVLLGWGINNELGGSAGVDGGHEAFNQTKLLVNNLGERGKAVGGARSVGDDGLTLVFLVVDTNDEHGGVWGRSSDNDFLSSALDVTAGALDIKEDTRGFNNDINVVIAPFDLLGVALSVADDLVLANAKVLLVVNVNSFSLSVDGIIGHEVGHVLGIKEGIIDSYDRDVSAGVINDSL